MGLTASRRLARKKAAAEERVTITSGKIRSIVRLRHASG
jgi:hypothetical protein